MFSGHAAWRPWRDTRADATTVVVAAALTAVAKKESVHFT